jgi:hypothetical protein
MSAVKQVGAVQVAFVVLVAVAFGFGLGLAQSTRASAATTTTVTVASGSPTVIVSGLGKGDVVDVHATLSTSDPGEIGPDDDEPEPLVLQSTGGFSWSFQVYGQPRAMRFTATVDDESLSGVIKGFDEDESASVTVTVNSTAQQFLSPQTKDLLDQVAASEAVLAAGSATAVPNCLAGVCASFYPSAAPPGSTRWSTQILRWMRRISRRMPITRLSNNWSSSPPPTYLPKTV